MRRILALLILTALCLSGCGGTENLLAPAIEFRAALVQAGGCSFTARVTADDGEATEEFTLRCEAEETGAVRFEVAEPQTLAGITALVSADGGTITYDGMAMDFGLLANGNVIPAAAPALVLCCWRQEYLAAAGADETGYRATYEKDFDEKRLVVDTWFENGIPFYAEVCYNNQRILKLELSDFKLD